MLRGWDSIYDHSKKLEDFSRFEEYSERWIEKVSV
jgi:hypothetical protein